MKPVNSLRNIDSIEFQVSICIRYVLGLLSCSCQIISLPDYSKLAANMLDIRYEQAIVGNYTGYNNFPGHDGMPEYLKKVFSDVHEIVSSIRW